MYQVPKDPQGRPVSMAEWLRDIGAFGLAIAILIFGVSDAISLGKLLGFGVGLAGIVGSIGLCAWLSYNYGRRKLEGKAAIRSAWLLLFGVALVKFVAFLAFAR